MSQGFSSSITFCLWVFAKICKVFEAIHGADSHDTFWKYTVHGLNALFECIHPELDPDGFWPEGSPSWEVAGQPIANGEFRDACAHEKIACSPACYRIRDRARPYHVMNHSFGFWSEEFYTDEVPAGFVLQTCPQETCPESVSVSSCAVATSTLGTENKERLVGTIASCAWRMETTSECMVCLSRPPTFVLKVCGHCGLCGHCWKWMCKEQFNKNRSERCQVSPAALKTKQVANVAIQCPYCRQVTQAVHHSRYTGTMYSV